MIVLGIDPGSTRIGYGLIKKETNSLSCISYGTIENKSKDKILRIKNTLESLSDILDKFNPDVSAVEKIFFFKNQKTVIEVSEMRGVILSGLAVRGIPVSEFTPLEVKQAVSSYGRAGKEQVQEMVRLILGLKEEVKPDDAADALAIAICYANNIIRKIGP